MYRKYIERTKGFYSLIRAVFYNYIKCVAHVSFLGVEMSQITKNALENSLKKLLLEKPLSKITVKDIAEDCGISRMTFYYHFRDVYELVEWSCYEDASRALEGKKHYSDWKEGFYQIFLAVKENKPFVLNVYHSVSREQIENYLFRLTFDLIKGVVEEESKGMVVRDEDKAFITNVYKYAFVGIVLDWIKGDMLKDPMELISDLEKVIHGGLKVALERFRLDKPLTH